MIGKLTIDKASMNLSYFLYTLKIINDNNGRVSRKNFGKLMGEFIGVPSIKGGKENRTPYNKSKLPRYFGFVDIEYGENNESFLVLTHRGKVLTNYIEDKGEDTEAAQRYGINQNNRGDFIDLIFESVIFDSFGKNNCGAEQSNTDVEPPKVVFKTIQELGSATAEEICYVMFGLNRGNFSSFDEAIEAVKSNRKIGKHDYKHITDEWEITNIVNDCKIINIFTDENIRLLSSQRDEENGKLYYSLSKTLDNAHREQIRTISVTYKPLRLFAYTNGNIKTVHQWVDDAVLGRVSDNSLVFRYGEKTDTEFCFDYSKSGSLVPGIFEQALLKAFNEEKKNVYIVLDGITEAVLAQKLGGLWPLLKHEDDFLKDDHGWSINPIENKRLYDYLTLYSVNAKNTLENQMVRLPSNIHIVGAIIMNENDRDIQFDYEFQRCLVNTEDDTNVVNSGAKVVNEKNRLTTGCNVLLYGVPGSGKSWTIEHEYCKPGSVVERLVFHPDYTYSDFIGQILPAVAEDGQVSYKFTPGPFTNILRESYHNPGTEYILIIEEINRGNAPAIFGEVFQLLDRKVEIRDTDDDGFPVGTSEYGITNMNIAEEMYGKERKTDKVRIPSNLSIIGTMNTSDQNVFTLDTAFQRRWDMRLIENDFANVDSTLADAEILDTTVTWRNFCVEINKIVVGNSARMTSAEDKRLGAYFVHLRDLKFNDAMGDLKVYDALRKKESKGTLTPEEKTQIAVIRDAMRQNRKFPEKVIKYLWDDAFKFNREVIFEVTEYQSLEQVIRAFMYAQGLDRFKVFKDNVKDAFTGEDEE